MRRPSPPPRHPHTKKFLPELMKRCKTQPINQPKQRNLVLKSSKVFSLQTVLPESKRAGIPVTGGNSLKVHSNHPPTQREITINFYCGCDRSWTKKWNWSSRQLSKQQCNRKTSNDDDYKLAGGAPLRGWKSRHSFFLSPIAYEVNEATSRWRPDKKGSFPSSSLSLTGCLLKICQSRISTRTRLWIDLRESSKFRVDKATDGCKLQLFQLLFCGCAKPILEHTGEGTWALWQILLQSPGFCYLSFLLLFF